MMINPTDLAKLNKIPDKRSRFLKRMIELPLVGTLLYHTLTGRSNIELLFTESYYHNPFHRSPEDVDAFYESAHLQSSAGKYLFASLAGNYEPQHRKPRGQLREPQHRPRLKTH